MKKIKRVGRTDPMVKLMALGITPKQFEKLRDCDTIEVTDEVFSQMRGVVETNETIVSEYKTFSKSKKKKKTSSNIRTQSVVDTQDEEAKINLGKSKSGDGLTLSETYRSFQTENE